MKVKFVYTAEIKNGEFVNGTYNWTGKDLSELDESLQEDIIQDVNDSLEELRC